jgi:hypothetical protein
MTAPETNHQQRSITVRKLRHPVQILQELVKKLAHGKTLLTVMTKSRLNASQKAPLTYCTLMMHCC